jgi:SAM-dependent methyltransferase
VAGEVRSRKRQIEVGLELGSGTCTDANFFLEQGFGKLIAVDACPHSAAYAAKTSERFGHRFQFHNAPIEEFEFEESRYDFVYSNATLHFLGRDCALWTMSQMVKSLKRDGLLAITVKGAEDWVRFKFPEVPLFHQWEIKDALFGLRSKIDPIIFDDNGKHIHHIRAIAWKD